MAAVVHIWWIGADAADDGDVRAIILRIDSPGGSVFASDVIRREVDALRKAPHPSHFNLDEALDWIARLNPKRAILTNLHSDMDYAALQAGLNVDAFGPRISFFFNAHLDFFEEVAKYRAARRLWAKIMKERFKAKDPRSLMIRFHTQTAGCTLTAQQPKNNIVRVAFQALAAVLGGTQSLHTNSMDEALCLPSEEAVQVALRSQQIVAYETDLLEYADIFDGSVEIDRSETASRISRAAAPAAASTPSQNCMRASTAASAAASASRHLPASSPQSAASRRSDSGAWKSSSRWT